MPLSAKQLLKLEGAKIGLQESISKYAKRSLDQATANDDRSVLSSDDVSPTRSSCAQPSNDHENLPQHQMSAESTAAASIGCLPADASVVVAQAQQTGNDALSGMLFRHMNVSYKVLLECMLNFRCRSRCRHGASSSDLVSK